MNNVPASAVNLPILISVLAEEPREDGGSAAHLAAQSIKSSTLLSLKLLLHSPESSDSEFDGLRKHAQMSKPSRKLF